METKTIKIYKTFLLGNYIGNLIQKSMHLNCILLNFF